jgi:hypothetical protein
MTEFPCPVCGRQLVAKQSGQHARCPICKNLAVAPDELADSAVYPEPLGKPQVKLEPGSIPEPRTEVAQWMMENRKAAVAIFVMAWVTLSWLVSALIAWSMRPVEDSNLEAYLLLDRVGQIGRFDAIKTLADQAYDKATDPEIRQFASILSRLAELNMRAGIFTVEEANSVSGGVKALVTGFFNPLLGLESAGAVLEVWSTDLQTLATNVDARYQPMLLAQQHAKTTGAIAFWLMSAAGIAVALIYRNRLPDVLQSKMSQLTTYKSQFNQWLSIR